MNPTLDFALDVPVNSVSFGQCATAILRELKQRGLHPSVFPIGGGIDLSTQKPDDSFNQWLGQCVNKAQGDHCRKKTAIKLWHINGSLQSYSETDSRAIVFHETDQITSIEVNVLRNQDRVYVTSRFTQGVFKTFGIESTHLPLGFDAHNFHVLDKRPKMDGVTSFGLAGKLEIRKSHLKILNLWVKRYGNRKEYRLNAALHNPFLKPEHMNALLAQAFEGKQYWNVNILPYMATNAEYNAFLQANDIHLALSGGEGFDLPAYHATALGAHTVALRAHVYTDYLNDENAVLVNPSGLRPAVDGIFFHANTPFNVGNFFDWSEGDFYAACEQAEKRAALGVNIAGQALQKTTYAPAVDILLKDLK